MSSQSERRRPCPSSVLRPWFCLLAAGLLPALFGCGPRLAPDAGQHVILISLDTTRADHLGFLADTWVQTPRLDELARESIVFSDYLTVVPTTLASHTTLLTGKYPHHHGVARNGFMVNRDNEMLPEILADAGFHTAGFAGSFALDERFDFPQGFAHYDEEFDILVRPGGPDQNQRTAAQVTDAVIRYLDRLEMPEHLFLFVHYFDPHYPYAAPAPFDRKYDPLGGRDLPAQGTVLNAKAMTAAERKIAVERLQQHYAAEISYLDFHLGRLLDDLRRRGILDRAVLLVTSDHGESLWEHNERFDHGAAVYQATMSAVWTVRLPDGAQGGSVVDQPAASIDVLPTLLDFLGLPLPAGIDGESFDLRTLADRWPSRPRFGQATKPWRQIETNPRWVNIRKSRCVRQDRYKFIQTPFLKTEELYDLTRDPDEEVNLLAAPTPDATAVAARLRPLLETWAAAADPLPSRFESAQAEETIRRLRSLGYVR